MPEKPHVLLICTDHWSGAYLGVRRHPVIQTPTIDQLARNGRLYTRAYSECPVCVPARRTLMTGTTTRTHGDRVFSSLPMPEGIPTLAQTFRNAGYQAYAVGKLHVHPQRDRIGFDDVLLHEEGRTQWGVTDDYELFLGDRGYVGQQMTHGMCNNEYLCRPWHLPEDCHVTNWTTQQMARMIKRRDPRKPGFWFLSYCHPHPPLAPLACYLDLYRDIPPDMPYDSEWAAAEDAPSMVRSTRLKYAHFTENEIRVARQGFYAHCTHIDHQLRVVIGTLREEGLLDNTIILFTSDHGDMLGNHGLWAKRFYYEQSAQVPMILVGVAGDERVGHHQVDDRLVGWQDVMPTLLDLCGIGIPHTVEGLSMTGEERRELLFGEIGVGANATRMMHDGRHKLVYYPAGNRVQLFDLDEDPLELHDVAETESYAGVREDLTAAMVEQFYREDLDWLHDGQLVGCPEAPVRPRPNRALSGQRGVHWPMDREGA